MVLPDTYASGLALLIFCIICLGSWANPLKLAGGRWRFELFYYDFSLGAVICMVMTAFTFGSLNSKELTFEDNFLITGYRNMMYAFGAGMLFNLGNMLLTAALSVSGMAIAFPASLGMAAIAAAAVHYLLNPQGDDLLLFGGVALVVVAIVLVSAAYASNIEARRVAANKAAAAEPNAPPRRRLPRAGRGIVLSAIGGIAMGLSYPLLTSGAWVEPAMGPYGTALLFCAGVLISTLLYNPFFMNFPVQGRPVEFKNYFKASRREHVLGLLAGAIWMAGLAAMFVLVNSRGGASFGPPGTFTIAQSALFIAMLWGCLAWRDFEGGRARVILMLAGMFVFFSAGLAAIFVAPVYGR